MRSRILWAALLLAVFVFVLPVRSIAQGCQGVMTPEYSTYTTISNVGNDIYSTAAVDGYTHIGNTEYCNINGTTHRGFVSNTLGGVGGEVYGGAVPPASYIGVVNPQKIVGVQGVIYVDSTDAWIACSAVGTIFSGGGSQNVSLPTISGPNTVWFFNYLTATGYATSIQLTSR